MLSVSDASVYSNKVLVIDIAALILCDRHMARDSIDPGRRSDDDSIPSAPGDLRVSVERQSALSGMEGRCKMGTATRSFGNICFFCIIGAVAAVGLITLGVVTWVALL